MFDNTKLVYKKILHDIDLAIHVVDIIIQVLFLGYYSYCAVTSFDKYKFLFFFYIALIAISIVWLLITIFRYKFEKNKKRFIGKIIKITKWSIRAAVITINVVIAVRYGTSDINIMLLILSIFFLIAQIAFELILDYVRHFYEILFYSFMKDAEELTNNVPKGVKFVDKVFKTGLVDKIKEATSKNLKKYDKEEELNKIKSNKK